MIKKLLKISIVWNLGLSSACYNKKNQTSESESKSFVLTK